MASFAAILRSFAADAERRDDENKWWQAGGLSLSDAIHRAGLSTIPGKKRLIRHGHQCRLPEAVLSEATQAILALESRIAAVAGFDELHALIRVACSSVQGTGPLYCYDVAHRIGLHLGIEPDLIYMHTGTREGAKALGIDVAGRTHIRVSDLPRPMRVLSAAEAEDVLCIYKSWFGDAWMEKPIMSRC
jgi:hypothetical protein